MLRHQSDVYMCRKRTGTHVGMVCYKCDDRCVICDGYAHLEAPVHICDDCNFSTSKANSTFLSLIHISEPTRLLSISYAVFCLKKKKSPHQLSSDPYHPTTHTQPKQ
eukprot:TRINITY_DN8063_c0_g1_i1.p1 TRINITY_DN8063_c0_g1~~TRINITY_DN8063_c0_g1_i1.p1  ORF type:complete len:107 (-),score=8.20 TRINITY_DN8063_c0_g1_i1:10-330(-)